VEDGESKSSGELDCRVEKTTPEISEDYHVQLADISKTIRWDIHHIEENLCDMKLRLEMIEKNVKNEYNNTDTYYEVIERHLKTFFQFDFYVAFETMFQYIFCNVHDFDP
jgi:hypothetical protein